MGTRFPQIDLGPMSVCGIDSATRKVLQCSLFASYLRDADPRLHGISRFMASDWHPTPSKYIVDYLRAANIGLGSRVCMSAGMSN